VAAYQEARRAFEALGEPAMVAVAWHQEATAQRMAGDPTVAERCYLASLEIETRLGNLAGQAATLNELGSLFGGLGRLEEAADLYRRAGALYARLGQGRYRAVTLSNLADTLRRLGRLDEARAAVQEAIRLDEPYGDAAQPWKTWAILADIERAARDPTAAALARSRAVALYRAFRDGGGSPHDGTGRLAQSLYEALARGADPADLAPRLPPRDRFSPSLHPFRAALEAILRGRPADLDDPAIGYDDAVELARLRDLIAARGGGGGR
jgi:tetratricopeptide (TPR) repeat protein